MSGMMTFIREHFFHVAPLLAAGALGLAIILERLWALFWAYPIRDSRHFFERVRVNVLADRLPDALAICDSHSGKPVALVVKEGLMRANQPEEMIADGLQLVVAEQSHRIQQRTAFLATVANVATLLGLFGTIAGLIASFEAVGSAAAQEKSALLAAGISTAMNATMLGLGVAIPCMIAFSYLMNRSNRLTAELEQAAMRTLDTLRQRLYGDQPQRTNSGQGTQTDRIRPAGIPPRYVA